MAKQRRAAPSAAKSLPQVGSDHSPSEAGKAAPQTRTRPTRTFPEYFYTLKNRHNFAPAVCIDVGAGYGTTSIYSAFPSALHLVVEPLKDLLPRLKATMAPYRSMVINGALTEQPGKRALLKAPNLLSSTLIHKNVADPSRLEEVDCFTLDSLMELVRDSGPILLKTDCQGADLQVVKGGLKTLERCEVVVMEASLFRFWGDHQPDFQDIVAFMKSQGFVVHDLLDGLFRPFDRALAQIDIAFVKEKGFIRKYRHWQ